MRLGLLTVMHPIGGEIPFQVFAAAITSHAIHTNANFLAASDLNVNGFIPVANLRACELTLLLVVAAWAWCALRLALTAFIGTVRSGAAATWATRGFLVAATVDSLVFAAATVSGLLFATAAAVELLLGMDIFRLHFATTARVRLFVATAAVVRLIFGTLITFGCMTTAATVIRPRFAGRTTVLLFVNYRFSWQPTAIFSSGFTTA